MEKVRQRCQELGHSGDLQIYTRPCCLRFYVLNSLNLDRHYVPSFTVKETRARGAQIFCLQSLCFRPRETLLLITPATVLLSKLCIQVQRRIHIINVPFNRFAQREHTHGFQVALGVKNLPVSAGYARDTGSNPGVGEDAVEKEMTTHSSILGLPWYLNW